jgi:hypothetical protein
MQNTNENGNYEKHTPVSTVFLGGCFGEIRNYLLIGAVDVPSWALSNIDKMVSRRCSYMGSHSSPYRVVELSH